MKRTGLNDDDTEASIVEVGVPKYEFLRAGGNNLPESLFLGANVYYTTCCP